MLIYALSNLAQSSYWFVCDSQATIDQIPIGKNGQPIYNSALCSVGTKYDADTLLLQYQNSWLKKQDNLFTVSLQNIVEGGVVWTVVNLDTEPENADRTYFVFDTTDGLYEEAIGLDAAKAQLALVKQEYLVFTEMSQYTIMTSWQ